jgi:CPA1 family monovalent cation:H+ antiporter
MGFTEIVIVLLLTIVVSNIVDSAFPKLPLPLILIVFGVLLTLPPLHMKLELETDVFMPLLVAPLLFRDAEDADLRALWKARKQVILMAFLLVFITVFAVGFSVHAVMPTIPLAACFALGAILGPTDAIAVTSISSRIELDGGIMAILKGEGLINDASGVISFHFAVAALLTGSFSPGEAILDFFILSMGGFIAGFVIVNLKLSIIDNLKRLEIRSNAAFMLVEILTPFICYLAAEVVGVSGIIAAVTAGIIQSLHIDHVNRYQAEFSIFKKSIWEMLTTAFSSIVFLLLGIQLPEIVREVHIFPAASMPFTILIGLFATVLVLGVRFVSSLILSGEVISEAAQTSEGNACGDVISARRQKLHRIGGIMKHSLALTLSGVKGTISLAMAFSLPFYITTNSNFPQRPFLLLVTATVIIVSLLVAVIVLPFIAKKSVCSARPNEKRIEILNKVLDELKSDSETYSNAIVMSVNMRVKELAREDMKPKERRELRKLREIEYKIEKDLIDGKYNAGAMSEQDYQIYLHIIAVMHNMMRRRIFGGFGMRKTFFRSFRKLRAADKRGEIIANMNASLNSVKRIFWENTSFIIEELRAQEGEDFRAAISEVVAERIDIANRIVSGIFGENAGSGFHDDYDRTLLKCYTMERAIIERYEQEGKLDSDEADNMRVEVNMLETYMIEDKHKSVNIAKIFRRRHEKDGA